MLRKEQRPPARASVARHRGIVTDSSTVKIAVDLAEVAEHIAQRAAALVLAELRAAPPPAGGLLNKQGIASAIGVSVATVDRFDREGAPHERVGNAKRYDLARYRGWLAERGSAPTTKTTATSDRMDATTETMLQRRGLRVVGSGR